MSYLVSYFVKKNNKTLTHLNFVAVTLRIYVRYSISSRVGFGGSFFACAQNLMT